MRTALGLGAVVAILAASSHQARFAEDGGRADTHVAAVYASSGNVSFTTFEELYSSETCDKCYDGASAHAFGDAGWWYPFFDASCTACNACHGNSQVGSCSQYHCACGGETLLDLKEEAANVVAIRDPSAMDALVRRHPEVLAYSLRGDKLLFLDCDLNLAGSLPITRSGWTSPTPTGGETVE